MKSSMLLLLLSCGLSVAAPTTAPSTDVPPTTAPAVASDKPINTHCPINRDEEIDPAVTTTYNGQTVAFCCKDCIKKFQKDPEKYMKDLK